MSELIFKSHIWTLYDKGLSYTKLKEQLCDLINTQTDLKCTGADIDNLLEAIKTLMVPVQDTVILIKQLKRSGMNIYGLTNMPKEIYDHLLATYNFFDDFSGITSSSYTGLAKPERPIYEKLLSDNKIFSGETIFLDDRQGNLIEAEKLGIKTILFVNAKQTRDQLNKKLNISLEKFFLLDNLQTVDLFGFSKAV